MPDRPFSQSLLRGISEGARELRVLARPNRLPSNSGSQASSLHLPEIRAPAQFLIDMGIQPALAEILSTIYMKFAAQHRKTFESYFDRAIYGGCRLPAECYRKMFVVQFERVIQRWGSQLFSTIWVWLRRGESFRHGPFDFKGVGLRISNDEKPEILSRLGLRITPPFVSNANEVCRSNRVCALQTNQSTNPVPNMVAPEKREAIILSKTEEARFGSITPSLMMSPNTTRHSNALDWQPTRTCFPAPYPPPPRESPHVLGPSFSLATASNVRKVSVDRIVDIPSVIASFGRMAISMPENDVTAQRSWNVLQSPWLIKTEPASAPTIGEGRFARKEANSAPRRRRIAALPTPSAKSSATIPPRSALRPAVSVALSDSFCSTFAGGNPLGSVPRQEATPPGFVPVATRRSAETSILPNPRVPIEKKRKIRPIPQRTSLRSQAILPDDATACSTPAGRRIPSHTLSRTPSLTSDASSYYDSPSSSSDELDTPPSSPPSPLTALSRSMPVVDKFLPHKTVLQESRTQSILTRRSRCGANKSHGSPAKGGTKREESPSSFTLRDR
ncbi:hypothetical protein BC834DRAFT_916993 [Gloeopeniophorella convolvens]|nr:hypothetical protein BC834DRAFT_916993 [Gloeopeniophorella convolvens]